MEHGQRGAESIGVILSGIAEILREVSDKLDAVAAKVEEDRPDDSALATRLAKLEAWAFRTEQDVAGLGTRVETIESGTVAADAPVDNVPRPQPAAARADSSPRPQPGSRAERRELAARAEQEPAIERPARAEGQLPVRGESQLPVRGDQQLPVRGESQPSVRVEHDLPTRDKPAARERLLPRAAASRGERTEATVNSHTDIPDPAPARSASIQVNGERRIPPVPAELHDWVDPIPATVTPTEPTPRSTTPRSTTQAPSVTPAAERTDSFTPRYEPVPVDAAASNGQHVADYTVHSDRLEIATSSNGRLEPPTLNGHASSSMTVAHAESETNGSHRSIIEETGHVDKLQAMLDELKRNPHGPFGKPIGSPGEMPA
ncbi:hypothetical protein [Nocardia noduli]|uniref:hypothetical protein n=1 Tax=Nocardia noduli TaxID=2815722 RepID=UPI001C24A876|nr:hypothetical protein [Nocardia noduli]